MKLRFSNSAAREYQILKADAPETARRIRDILQEALLHPESGAGNPTKLEGAYEGLWQRVYSPLGLSSIVYYFDADALTVVSIGGKERAMNLPRLEPYSKTEERSVMSQMEANRGKDHEPKVGIFWYNRATNQLFGVVSHRVSDYTFFSVDFWARNHSSGCKT